MNLYSSIHNVIILAVDYVCGIGWLVGCWRIRMLIYENSQNCKKQHTVILLHQMNREKKIHLQSLKQKQKPEEDRKKKFTTRNHQNN